MNLEHVIKLNNSVVPIKRVTKQVIHCSNGIQIFKSGKVVWRDQFGRFKKGFEITL